MFAVTVIVSECAVLSAHSSFSSLIGKLDEDFHQVFFVGMFQTDMIKQCVFIGRFIYLKKNDMAFQNERLWRSSTRIRDAN